MINKDDYKQAVKSSTRSAIFTLTGFLIVAASIGYSIIRLGSVEDEIKERKTEIAALEKQKESVKDSINLLKAEAEYYQQVLSVVQQNQPDLVQEAINTPEIQQVATEKIQPRVYIHISDKSQKVVSDKMTKLLEGSGFLVPGTEIVGRLPQNNQLRYFRDMDKSEAESIAAILNKSIGMLNLEVTFIKGYESSEAIRPRHYEIWLSAEEMMREQQTIQSGR